MDVVSIVLAAGEGKRMNSSTPKVLHEIAGKKLIEYALEACEIKGCRERIVVVGANGDLIKNSVGDGVKYVVQEEQKGTGHAVMCAGEYLENIEGYVLILAADMPLITSQSMQMLLDYTAKSKASAGLLTLEAKNPKGYGRIIRDDNDSIIKIVEEKDANKAEKKVREVNVSLYCFEAQALRESLKNLENNNSQLEYYLTDCIDFISKNGRSIVGMKISEEEGLGVNDLVQLEYVERLMRKRINRKHMLNGVRIIDSSNTYIDACVEIGKDTVIHPGNSILGNCKIGENVLLKPGNTIEDSSIGNNCQVGPNAHFRPKSNISDNCKVGNFVELKNIDVGFGSKVPHLSYCGDGSIGERVNIGCGVIFTNYDGVNKYNTVVEDDAFVGCNSNLIAPVTVGKNAYIASGSTIVSDVPKDALAIARNRQTNKKDWAVTSSPKAISLNTKK